MSSITNEKVLKETLRVALDKEATAAFLSMADKLKAENTYVKFSSSDFVSFLISEFYKTHFEKEMRFFISHFFDSHSYYESATKRAKCEGNFEKVMLEVLAKIQEIKRGKRQKRIYKKRENKSVLP